MAASFGNALAVAPTRRGGWGRALRRAADRWLDWIYPPVCRDCGRSLFGCDDALLCADCHARFPWLGAAVCAVCGVMTTLPAPAPPVSPANGNSSNDAADDAVGANGADAAGAVDPQRVCRRCRRRRPAYDAVLAVARYRRPARELVLALKYAGDRGLAGGMAAAMAWRWRTAVWPSCDLIVPVPLHASRQRARGYNQSSLLARALAKRPDGPRLPCREGDLRRVVATVEQTRLTGQARRAFPADAFRARGDWRGARVLLVDDVVTTGATVESCASALRLAGASSVHVLSFAR